MSYLRKDQKENVTVGQTKTTIFICISVMPDNSKAVIIAIKHGMGAGAGGGGTRGLHSYKNVEEKVGSEKVSTRNIAVRAHLILASLHENRIRK